MAWRTAVADWIGVTVARSSGYRLPLAMPTAQPGLGSAA
jgi:hypothetical protein